jgi:hypothetical protein
MKKALLYALLAVLCFSSCKKDKKPTPTPPTDTKTYSVKFRISDLNGQKISSSGATKVNDVVTIPSSVTRIIYSAINTTTLKVVSLITQDRGAANFGSIEDNLPPGTYTINISAASKVPIFNVSSMYLKKEINSGLSTNINNDAYWDDAFATSFQITVSSQPIDQSVSLHRIVGQVTVKLLDALPANAYSLKVDVSNEYDFYNFSTDNAIPQPSPSNNYPNHTHSKTVLIPAAAIGTTNYMQSYLILNTGSGINHAVDITCYDSAGKIIAQSSLANVIIQRNTNTILSGKIFGEDSEFTISLDQNWGTPINVGF